MAALSTEVLIIGSGAGGAVTAAALAAAGRSVTVVEEGPWVDADSVEPFSLDEMVAKYRHHGLAAALGNPAVAYAEGRCVGGSTEINSGLYNRLPDDLADEWRRRYSIDEFTPAGLAGYADRVESQLSVTTVPGAPPASSAVLERGATKLGWRNVEFSRVFSYDRAGRGTKQTMSRTLLPRAVAHGAKILPDTRVVKLARRGDTIVGAQCRRRRAPDSEGRPGLRVRRRGAHARPATAQRHPPQRGQRAEDASHGQDRGPVPLPARPRRGAHAPGH